jgi:uncharacterized protein
VLDTNIWISALLWGGKPAEIITAAEKGQVSIYISEDITAEIAQVLAYPKIERMYQGQFRREDLIEQILKIAKFVEVKVKVNVVEEHWADNKFLECALASKAHYVISGDKHLLKLQSYKRVKILPVSDLLLTRKVA